MLQLRTYHEEVVWVCVQLAFYHNAWIMLRRRAKVCRMPDNIGRVTVTTWQWMTHQKHIVHNDLCKHMCCIQVTSHYIMPAPHVYVQTITLGPNTVCVVSHTQLVTMLCGDAP